MGVTFTNYGENLEPETEKQISRFFTSPIWAGHEFIAMGNPHGIFYYMCSDKVDLDQYQFSTGFCIIERSHTYPGYYIGRGLYHTTPFYGLITNAIEQKDIPAMEKPLRSFMDYDKGKLWYELDSDFQPPFRSGDHDCYYIHDYYPQACPEHRRKYQGLINNTIFGFKDGEAGPVVAKLFSMAILKNDGIIRDKDNTLLLCIPASTKEKHEKRFRRFSSLLAGYLGIEDGFDLLRVEFDRESGDIRKGMPVTENLRLEDYGACVEGKHIILCDDIYTSGKSFDSLAAYLMAADALSVTGVFLGKTIKTK